MTIALPVAPTPTIPVYIGAPNSKRRCFTVAFAERLRRAAEEVRGADSIGSILLYKAAWNLSRCARAGRSGSSWRCEAAYCPRCARRKAIRYRKRLERRMRARVRNGAAAHGFALITLTVAAAEARQGLRVLQRARARFVRRRPVRALLADAWNVHLHAIVELRRRFRDVDTSALQSLWTQVLGSLGAQGSLHLRQCRNLTVELLRDAAP
jgi:hypothetical protein